MMDKDHDFHNKKKVMPKCKTGSKQYNTDTLSWDANVGLPLSVESYEKS